MVRKTERGIELSAWKSSLSRMVWVTLTLGRLTDEGASSGIEWRTELTIAHGAREGSEADDFSADDKDLCLRSTQL